MAAAMDRIMDAETENLIEVEMEGLTDSFWSSYSSTSSRVVVEDMASASCYVFTDPHIITYDGVRFDVYSTGTFTLHQVRVGN